MIALLSMALCLPAQREDRADDIRVMSFNIRYGSASDGENSWDHRKEFLIDSIRAVDPDILGTQETLAFQRDDLLRGLPGYEVLAAGRDDGAEAGEMMALFYKADRFERLRGGHFWLSETPETAGSTSWDSSLPRMVTWVELRDLTSPDSRPIAVFNTHFDHRGRVARVESARLIRSKIAELASGALVVVTGDFNAAEGSEPYRALFDGDAPDPQLIDTYRAVHPERSAGEGTFSGFRAEDVDGPRIDWIAASPGWEVRSATIERPDRDGRTPSDHFAVTAVLRPVD
ncbi:endonuclease/exonuclease/phosphatase family protein [Tautonia sociabilis]|uniref:Endonuclease/exonuclease/phosphatase family protein n=1 Tax=Tautonia sociabilis TaxID=2080755 RepID=A0A432MFB3_9BACT|nr:endonuclease/exonuclease/phosphatase family protein [Tautonia sociabilis]RUL84680.1 endonuclease/exonuclease/phosphatase family protein [Tautonia sociabilis]